MNMHARQKKTHRHRKQTCGYKGGRRGSWQIRSSGLIDTNDYIQNRWATQIYYIA